MEKTNVEKSACGLPSRVVIDMAGRAVQRTEAEWRALLTPEQFRVTRRQGTEPPFHNAYWDHHEDGVYFSVGSDTPLFDSRDKFESGHGLAEFFRPIEAKFVATEVDESHGMRRIEAHCGGRRRAPRACVRGRAASDRAALLHQLGRAAIHAARGLRALADGTGLSPYLR